jgi:hypothetical protein
MVKDVRFVLQSLGLTIKDIGYGIHGLGIRVYGSGFQGFRFRV